MTTTRLQNIHIAAPADSTRTVMDLCAGIRALRAANHDSCIHTLETIAYQQVRFAPLPTQAILYDFIADAVAGRHITRYP